MKICFAAILMTLSIGASAGVVEEFLKVLPVGTHEGHNCHVAVYSSFGTGFQVQVYKKDTLFLNANFSENFTRVSSSSFGDNFANLNFTTMPDDGYSGKDKVKLSVKNGIVNLGVKGFGPIGIFAKTKKISCTLI